MASQAKKNKAKNSYIVNGGEKVVRKRKNQDLKDYITILNRIEYYQNQDVMILIK